MTYAEARKLLPRKWDWLPWNWMTHKEFFMVLLVGLLLGGFGIKIYDLGQEPPPIVGGPISVQLWNGYVAVEIDRTRYSYCDLHPSKVMFTDQNVNGVPTRVVLPVGVDMPTQLQLGHDKYLLLVEPVSAVPPGLWFYQVTRYENCNLLQELRGGVMQTTTPVPIKIP